MKVLEGFRGEMFEYQNHTLDWDVISHLISSYVYACLSLPFLSDSLSSSLYQSFPTHIVLWLVFKIIFMCQRVNIL